MDIKFEDIMVFESFRSPLGSSSFTLIREEGYKVHLKRINKKNVQFNLFGIPGIVDGHTHALMAAERAIQANLSNCFTQINFCKILQDKEKEHSFSIPLLGFGWNEQKLNRCQPDITWIPKNLHNKKVVLWRQDYHAALVSPQILHDLGPLLNQYGDEQVSRDQNGKPTGILKEEILWNHVHPMVKLNDSNIRSKVLRESLNVLPQKGITGIVSMEYAKDLKEVWSKIPRPYPVDIGFVLLDRLPPPDPQEIIELENNFGFKIIGMKSFVDGTLGSRTARMSSPYKDKKKSCGLFVEHALENNITGWLQSVKRLKKDAVFHAIGDEAFTKVLDFSDSYSNIRIEHAQFIKDSDLKKLKGIHIGIQPLHLDIDHDEILLALDNSTISMAYRLNDISDSGALMCFGTDWPIVSSDPIKSLKIAITGYLSNGTKSNIGQVLSVKKAIEAYTINSGSLLGRSSQINKSKPTMTVFDRNPFECCWISSPPKVVMTILDGKIMWRNGSE